MLDLDFNGILAQSDPEEMQTPICQPITEPTQDPAGGDIKHTAHLYVLLPMFSVDGDQDPNDAIPCPKTSRPGELCGPALGQTLVSLFGFIPGSLESKGESGDHDAVSRPKPCCPWYLHDACFDSRSIQNANCAGKGTGTVDSAGLCTNT